MVVLAEYTARGTNEELPLGEEFQNLVRCFISQNEKKPVKRYAPARKLIEQLWCEPDFFFAISELSLS